MILGRETLTDLTIRTARTVDAEALHALISSHVREGHLLPRDLEELRRHAGRFMVCDVAGEITACAELAPLSGSVAEVRSLVVSRHFRRVGLAARMVGELRARAKAAGFETLCAFTHDARFFVRQNFSIVPHLWLPEKISTDCLECPLFRRCEQYAMVLDLHEIARYTTAEPTVYRTAVA
jgi:amino-acid N-acetyltransferase